MCFILPLRKWADRKVAGGRYEIVSWPASREFPCLDDPSHLCRGRVPLLVHKLCGLL